MAPFEDYTSLLLPSISRAKITTLSCGHVVDRSSIFARAVAKGPTGSEFKWTYENRKNFEMMDELGRALVNICTVVPDGVVVFFPSYDFLNTIYERFCVVSSSSSSFSPPPPPGTGTGTQKASAQTSPTSILTKLLAKKRVFIESKTESVDYILANYARSIDEGKGGLLFSVVGGKLSEGINFSDGLGRCVVIVGLPFPNSRTAEWRRKLEFVREMTVARLALVEKSGSGGEDMDAMMMMGNGNAKGLRREEISKQANHAANEYYQNTCMRAVNQSVGRAIRHRGDWAGILMVDERYRREGIRAKLAGWIRGAVEEGVSERLDGDGVGARRMGMIEEEGFGRLIGGLGRFCREKRG